MDIKHVLSRNPLQPAYTTVRMHEPRRSLVPPAWIGHDGGLVEIGHDGRRLRLRQRVPSPRRPHRALRPGRPPRDLRRVAGLHGGRRLRPTRPVAVRRLGHSRRPSRWDAPLYWFRGRRRLVARSPWAAHSPVDLAEPVCHVSYYEADAFARWAGARLPTEAEWEAASPADSVARAAATSSTSSVLHPRPVAAEHVAVRRRVAVDVELLQPLSGVPPRARRRRRVQRQVHGQPVRAARRQLRHPVGPRPGHLPQLLPAVGPLGLHRPAPGPRLLSRGHRVTDPDTLSMDVHLDAEDLRGALEQDDVRTGLSAAEKRLPPVWFYDDARQRAVRRDHAAPRVLPDPGRAAPPRGPRPGDRRRRPEPTSGGAGGGDMRQVPGPARRHAGHGTTAARTCRST